MIASYNQSNRVYALLVTKQKTPTLKFAIPCLQYSIRIQCALFNSCMLTRHKIFSLSIALFNSYGNNKSITGVSQTNFYNV